MKSVLSRYTFAGVISIVLWSTTIAFTRSVIEKMGILNTAFLVTFFSGMSLHIFVAAYYRQNFFTRAIEFNKTFILPGFFFISYILLFNLALGLATTREAIITVGLINYLWPGFIIIFSIPILRKRANYILLISGILMTTAGTFLAVVPGVGIGFSEFTNILNNENILPYILAFAGAVSWGLYSNYTSRIKNNYEMKMLPVLFYISAVVLLLLIFLTGGSRSMGVIDTRDIYSLVYLIIFPSSIAYLLWDITMKKGNRKIITGLSYLIPIFSTLISGLYLDIEVGIVFWLASVLVSSGAFLAASSLH